jgi:hypothetical protein
MNIAFSAILAFALLLPGLIYLSAYQNGIRSWISLDGGNSLARNIAGALIASLLLHYAWIGVAARLGYAIDFQALLIFLTGYSEEKSLLFANAIKSAASSSQQIAWYFLTLYLAAAILGFFSNLIVAWLGLDGLIPLLRQRNHWSYLLSGRLSCFAELEQDFGGRPVYGVFATAIVRHEEGSFLYRGLIVDWVCRSNGELDRIILEAVRRRKLDDDRKPRRMRSPSDYHLRLDKRYYEVEGNYFALRYSEISTLNLEYVPDFRFRRARRRFPVNWWEFRRLIWFNYLKLLARWRFLLKRHIRPCIHSCKLRNEMKVSEILNSDQG